jgi:hypothetical protein
MLKVIKQKRLTSLLGLTFDGSRLEGVWLKRTNGSAQIQKSFSVLLSLDPLTAAPELVGREIRNHLDTAGVRERLCVVGLPLKWALTTHVEVPVLEPADAASFVQIEAERGFPCDMATLQICTSRIPQPSGKGHALLAGMPRNHIASLQQVLRAARLHPLSFSVGLMALQPPSINVSDGVLALLIGDTGVALQVSAGGGVAALRTIEGALETEGAKRSLVSAVVAREVRITLGQLPDEIRATLSRIRVFGPRELAQALVDELELRFESVGLKVELVTRYVPAELGVQVAADAPVSGALSLAATRLAGRMPEFDFLPPHVSALRQLTQKYSTGKLRTTGAIAIAAVLLIGSLFLYQQIQLLRLESQWNSMASKVKDLAEVQAQIRQFRPWYDENNRVMTILRDLTTAFPEEGVVSAKTVEIREAGAVTCTGVARDNSSLLRTLDRLQAGTHVSDLKVSQIRGRSPMQFTFDFRWNEGTRNER